MNIKNNKRRRDSVEKIEKAMVELLQKKEIRDISVSELCSMTGLNRSTFYANFIDIYDLADKLRGRLEEEFSELFADYDTSIDNYGALKMFTHIRDNQIFYKTYFKLCYDEKHMVSIYDSKQATQSFTDSLTLKYHIEFFRNGLNAIIKLWMEGGCKETPEQMAEFLRQEYRGR